MGGEGGERGGWSSEGRAKENEAENVFEDLYREVWVEEARESELRRSTAQVDSRPFPSNGTYLVGSDPEE